MVATRLRARAVDGGTVAMIVPLHGGLSFICIWAHYTNPSSPPCDTARYCSSCGHHNQVLGEVPVDTSTCSLEPGRSVPCNINSRRYVYELGKNHAATVNPPITDRIVKLSAVAFFPDRHSCVADTRRAPSLSSCRAIKPNASGYYVESDTEK